MEESKRKRPPTFKLEIPASAEKKQEMLHNLQSVREVLVRKLGRPVNNTDIMDALLNSWKLSAEDEEQSPKTPGTFINVKRGQVNQDFFVTSLSPIKKLMDITATHGRYCHGKLEVRKVTKRGHVVSLKLCCTKPGHAPHKYIWASSPYLPNGKYLINQRINHAFLCSGMLPSHYSRFCTSAGLGVLSKEKRTSFFKMYKTFVQQEYEDSISTALLEEIGMYEDLDGIDIITDARHGWRKNAKDTSVVAVGEKSHKILNCVHITTADDPVTQRHEKIGTEKIYRDLEAEQVTVQIHTHDRNLSINKMVKEIVSTTNQHDIWHGI